MKGKLEGPTGYIQLALRALSEALTEENSRWKDLLVRLKIATVLPVRELKTWVPFCKWNKDNLRNMHRLHF